MPRLYSALFMANLVRLFLVIHIDVFGIDYVARFAGTALLSAS